MHERKEAMNDFIFFQAGYIFFLTSQKTIKVKVSPNILLGKVRSKTQQIFLHKRLKKMLGVHYMYNVLSKFFDYFHLIFFIK
jgi:hypothetical protein